jgi:AcrR family transcriptional regulator
VAREKRVDGAVAAVLVWTYRSIDRTTGETTARVKQFAGGIGMTQPATPPACGSEPDTRTLLLDAAGACVRIYGYAGLSTRRVAEAAGVPLSQIHYHFGSRDGLVLALLDHQNQRLLERQRSTFAADLPLWQRWDKACDYLDEDIASGYVRILQEMAAAGFSKPDIAAAIRRMIGQWQALLAVVAEEAIARLGSIGDLQAVEIATLISAAFLGSESLLLLGFEDEGMPIRRSLRRVGKLIRTFEQAKTAEVKDAGKTPNQRGRRRS